MNKFKKALPWLLLVLLMVIIFYLSDQPIEESRDLTRKTKTVIKTTVGKFIPLESMEG